MDLQKFTVLADLVKQAKEEDRRAFSAYEQAQTDWKRANTILTERMKVFDDFVAQQKNEAIALDIPA